MVTITPDKTVTITIKPDQNVLDALKARASNDPIFYSVLCAITMAASGIEDGVSANEAEHWFQKILNGDCSLCKFADHCIVCKLEE